MRARDPQASRTAILDSAEKLVLARGFAGSGLAAILAETGLTKGAFFHHFPSKAALADALVERWAYADAAQLESKLARAQALTRDPVQQLVVFIGLFIEEAETLERPDPGCLFGAFCYQEGLLDAQTMQRVDEAMQLWRRRLRAQLDRACAVRPPRADVELDSLADLVTVTFEGAFIMAKATGEAGVLAAQLRHLRTYLELLFDTSDG